MRYIIWVMALLDACDVTNNGRHLGFYQELEISLKPREIAVFVLYKKNNTQIRTLHDFSLKIYFNCCFIVVRPRVKMIKFGKNCITSDRSHIIRRFPTEMDQTI